MDSITHAQAVAQAREARLPTEISHCRTCGQWHVWYDEDSGRTGHSGTVDFCRCDGDPAAPWFRAVDVKKVQGRRASDGAYSMLLAWRRNQGAI